MSVVQAVATATPTITPTLTPQVVVHTVVVHDSVLTTLAQLANHYAPLVSHGAVLAAAAAIVVALQYGLNRLKNLPQFSNFVLSVALPLAVTVAASFVTSVDPKTAPALYLAAQLLYQVVEKLRENLANKPSVQAPVVTEGAPTQY